MLSCLISLLVVRFVCRLVGMFCLSCCCCYLCCLVAYFLLCLFFHVCLCCCSVIAAYIYCWNRPDKHAVHRNFVCFYLLRFHKKNALCCRSIMWLRVHARFESLVSRIVLPCFVFGARGNLHVWHCIFSFVIHIVTSRSMHRMWLTIQQQPWTLFKIFRDFYTSFPESLNSWRQAYTIF